MYNRDPWSSIFLKSTDELELGSWTQTQLSMYVDEVFRKKTQDYHFVNGASINLAPSPLSIGALKVSAILAERAGMAGPVGLGGTESFQTTTKVDEVDTPAVIYLTTSETPISQIMSARQELSNQAAGINFDREAEDMKNMGENILQAIHLLWGFGKPTANIYGTVNNPNVTLVADATDIHAATDPQVMLDWLLARIGAVWEDSKTVEKPNAVALPPKLLRKFASKFFSSSDHSVLARAELTALKTYNRNIMFKAWPELESATLEEYGVHASGLNKDRMVIYSGGDGIMSENGVAPRYGGFFGCMSPFFYPPVTTKNIMQEKSVAVCVAGVQNHYPGSAQYVTFTKG